MLIGRTNPQAKEEIEIVNKYNFTLFQSIN
jgi:hypothetical protein